MARRSCRRVAALSQGAFQFKLFFALLAPSCPSFPSPSSFIVTLLLSFIVVSFALLIADKFKLNGFFESNVLGRPPLLLLPCFTADDAAVNGVAWSMFEMDMVESAAVNGERSSEFWLRVEPPFRMPKFVVLDRRPETILDSSRLMDVLSSLKLSSPPLSAIFARPCASK